MKPITAVIAIIVVALAAAAGGFWLGAHRSSRGESTSEESDAGTKPAEEDKPVAEVTVAPLKRARIEQTVTAYGSVVAQAADVRVLAAPFESRVVQLLVAPGEQVAAGADLVRLEASPDALIALEEARNVAAGAQSDLQRTQQRFNDRLATNAELAQARQAADSAQLKLRSMTQRGVGTAETLKAAAPGIVSKIDVLEGQIIPAGGAVVELAAGNRIDVALGVEPGDAAALKVGQNVRLAPVDRAADRERVEGQVRMIGQRVDPATRLDTVLVSLPPDAHLMLETFVTGEIVRASADALVVPRDAILPQEDGGYALYTVENEKAKKHTVRIGLENDRATEVIADDLKPGDPVVVAGNYQLEDGMAVKSEAATEPASTPEPATVPATSAATAERSTAPAAAPGAQK